MDYYVFIGYKWFVGFVGVGGLYIYGDVKGMVNVVCLGEINLIYVGWCSIIYGSKGEFIGWVEGGKRFEVVIFVYF